MLARRIAKELEKSKHCGIYEPELSRIWPHSGKPREPQIAFFGEQRGLPASLLRRRPAQFFDEKPSPLSYYLLRFVLRFRWPGLTLLALDCIFGAPLRAAAITHRKNRVRSTSMFPFLDYAPTERADDPKITLSAPALHQRRYRIHSEAWFHCSPRCC
ncbi:MAG: hypothetical protein DME58_00265 [Verrucomicrobia bacterium]|nr:MAG: hypothetical protein DME58_00265 [Verrucomicrobiota bacterium]